MNIKDKIGQRIRLSRKKQNLSLEELALKTGTFSAARIGNWERGQRVPGPTEILQLAKILQVSPAYLYCFSEDDQSHEDYFKFMQLKTIPILSLHQLAHTLTLDKSALSLEHTDQLLVEDQTALKLQPGAFAITLDDTSMSPLFEKGDIIIVNPSTSLVPGQYVVAQLTSSEHAVFRKYRELSKSANGTTEFELVPHHPDWPTIKHNDANHCRLLGIMVELRRYA